MDKMIYKLGIVHEKVMRLRKISETVSKKVGMNKISEHFNEQMLESLQLITQIANMMEELKIDFEEDGEWDE